MNITEWFCNGENELVTYESLYIFLPFFLRFITDFVSVYSKQMMRSLLFTNALFSNENINKEKYCQSFLSIVLSICISPTFFKGQFKFDVRKDTALLLSKLWFKISLLERKCFAKTVFIDE